MPFPIRTTTLLLGAAIVTLAGCAGPDHEDAAMDHTQAYLDQRLESGEVYLESFYSERFLEFTSEEDWANIQSVVDSVHGDLAGFTMVSFSVSEGALPGGTAGWYATFLLETRYERGTGNEQISLFRSSPDAPFRIVGHRIDSPDIRNVIRESLNRAAEASADPGAEPNGSSPAHDH